MLFPIHTNLYLGCTSDSGILLSFRDNTFKLYKESNKVANKEHYRQARNHVVRVIREQKYQLFYQNKIYNSVGDPKICGKQLNNSEGSDKNY